MFFYRNRFASQASLESLLTNNQPIPDITIPSDSISISTTSLDKVSVASNRSFPQRQQSTNPSEKVRFITKPRSA